jgi:RsmE family RNA methyltransferase
MRLHRFYISTPIGGQTTLHLAAAKDISYASMIKQWRDVFRYITGSRVMLFDGTGNEYLAMIEKLGYDYADLIIVEKTKDEDAARETVKKLTQKSVKGEVSVKKSAEEVETNDEESTDTMESVVGGLCLLVSILKGDHFELVVQKATELGVDHIVPLLCDRTIKKNINMDRCKKIIIEAVEQSGRVTLPEIHSPVSLSRALENFDGNLIVCMQGGEKLTKKMLGKTNGKPLGFIVGPEGGWSDKEIALFQKNKLKSISINENVLRAETAAISVIALAKNILM